MHQREVITGEEPWHEIQICLQDLLTKAKGHSVLLADATGQLLGMAGISNERDATALSTLAAGSFAATSEMTKFLGQNTRFEQGLYESKEYSIYSVTVGDEFLLTITFDASAKLGLVRIFTEQAVKRLTEIVSQIGLANHQEDINDLIDAEFGQLIADQLDNLFTD